MSNEHNFIHFTTIKKKHTLEACNERARVEFKTPDITVHIRWGDKWLEMGLLDISAYVNKVHDVIRTYGLRPDAIIFLMTEDYRALDEFRALADPRWRVLVYEPAVFPRTTDLRVDQPSMVANRGNSDVSTNSLVALFMCLESSHYIGASGSNWTRLMNELRQTRQMYSRNCHGCTYFHDLQYKSVGAESETEGNPSFYKIFEW